METIESKMRDAIRGWGRGRIFFLEDFAFLYDPVSVRQFICGLVEEGFVLRLARGIYCFPELSGDDHSRHAVIPTLESIAYALAERENVRIIPYGDFAAVKLGISSMVVSHHRYLTDGSPRTINVSSKDKIYFNHTSEVKMFAFRNRNMQMLSSAIRALGAEYFENEEVKRKVRGILEEVPQEQFEEDIKFPPAWVGKIIISLWN